MNKIAEYRDLIYKEASSRKIKELDKAFPGPTEREIAYMIATSHEYKKPNVKAALSFVKNYKWEKSRADIKDLQGIDKPVNSKKVEDMAKKMKTVKPFITVNQFNGIRPQTPGKKILIDGHHRKAVCELKGVDRVPIYKGTYTGDAEKPTSILKEDTSLGKAKGKVTSGEALKTLKALQVNLKKSKFKLKDFVEGMNVELEHGTEDPQTNVTDNDLVLTGKIALRHLKESPEYYRLLKEMEKKFKRKGDK